MSLISVVLLLIAVGFVLYLVNRFIPMDRKIKEILNIVVVLVVILWLLRAFGVFGSFPDMHL
ncbi:MAG: Thivi_2564 family membrane protein [Bacteroidota bacterium]